MRRIAAWLLAAAVAGPALLVLAVPGVDVDALRCAASCGHEARSGAVCCPVNAGGPGAWRKCHQDDKALAGAAAVSPAPLRQIVGLEPPDGSHSVPAVHPSRTASAFEAPPDHVPLSLS